LRSGSPKGGTAIFRTPRRQARIHPASDALIVNNYPPLSFYVTGLLGKLLGDNLFDRRWGAAQANPPLVIQIQLSNSGERMRGRILATWIARALRYFPPS